MPSAWSYLEPPGVFGSINGGLHTTDLGDLAVLGLGQIFGDETTAVAMIDRLVHHAEILSLNDHAVLSSIGSVGDAYDNAMAESFVDSFKTELIRDRVWQTRSQLELAIVQWVAWFNDGRLREALGDPRPRRRQSSKSNTLPGTF